MSSNTKWQLTDSAAELYEKFLVPTIFVPWAEYLINEIPPKDELVNDILTGFGEYFDATSLKFPHVSNVVSATLP